MSLFLFLLVSGVGCGFCLWLFLDFSVYLFDEIPVNVLKNNSACFFLLRLFTGCFSVGKVPNEWPKCVLSPIPKPSSLNKTYPLSYRGIALVPASYKLCCALINGPRQANLCLRAFRHDKF